MQKTAQKRSILNKLREMTNVSGIAAEKFFNPEFQRVMESLREKDDAVRAIVSGQQIGSADPGDDPVSMKELLKSAKSNLNRREYMTAVSELGRFHKKMADVILAFRDLSANVDQVHHEFLFRDLGDEQKKQLESLKTRFASERQTMIKEASLWDFLVNIGSKRGRALAAWEKRYPKQVNKLKKDTASLLSRSEMIFSQLLSVLKDMASARATRNVDNYMKGVDKINKGYEGYNNTFKEYYNSNIKGFLEKVEFPTEKVPEAKELGKQDIPTEKKKMEIPTEFGPTIKTDVTEPPTSQSMPTTPSPPPSGMSVPPSIPVSVQPPAPSAPTALAPGMPAIPPTPSAPTGVPSKPADTTPSPPPSFAPESEKEEEYPSDLLAKQMWSKSSHAKFLASLESLSGESPLLLAAYIKKYATKIQSDDPEVSLHLFKIAKSIKG